MTQRPRGCCAAVIFVRNAGGRIRWPTLQGQTSIPLGGTIIYDNGTTLRVEVTAGQLTFNPELIISGDIADHRLTAFDSEISGTVGLDMTLQATAQAMGDFAGSRPFPGTMPISTRMLAGAIPLPPPLPPIPVYVEAVLELNIGYEAHLEAIGTATWGFQSSRTLTIGAMLRNGQWSHNQQESSSFASDTPRWQINASGRLRGYLQPKLTLYLERGGINVAGVSADLKPYLELEKACVQPVQNDVDLSLYAGLTSTLALDVRWWDKDWGNLPSWELFNLRQLIYHPKYLIGGGDFDDDGMADPWEAANDASDASLDPDGDGMTNVQEYQAGTNPHDAQSVLRITGIEIIGGQIHIFFASVRGKRYRIERLMDMANATWAPVLEYYYACATTEAEVIDLHPNEANHMYRVLLLLP